MGCTLCFKGKKHGDKDCFYKKFEMRGMMNEAGHTPTPWVASGKQVRYLAETGAVIADCEFFGVEGKANAAFIVRAVNSHEELVKALKTLLEASHNGPERILREDEIEAMIKARTAIARAEGK